MVDEKDIRVKMMLTCDLTGVPFPKTDEDVEVKCMQIKARLVKFVNEKSRPVKQLRESTQYKYDRIIGYARDGALTIFPLDGCECEVGILLSDLICDAEVFYHCSGPVVQTSEKRVRAIFSTAYGIHSAPIKPGFTLRANEDYTLGGHTVRCKFGQSYYGKLTTAYILTVFYDSENNVMWDKYAKQVLTGKLVCVPEFIKPFVETTEEPVAPEPVAPTGNRDTTPHALKSAKTYMEAIENI